MLTNADSLSNTMSELRHRLDNMEIQPDIIAITEAKPKKARFTLTYADYQLKGYEAFTHNVESSTGRGIIIYVRNTPNTVILNLNSAFSEHLILQIRMSNNELPTYGCIYRSPNSHDTNNESLNTLIYELDQVKSTYKLLVGDFNLGSICWEDGIASSTTESTFVYTLQDTYMTQHVTEPTRGRNGQEPSILDLIISNDFNIVSDISHESPLEKSDHTCLTFYLKCYRNTPDQTRKFYLYDKGDFKQINLDLANINWEKEIGHLADPSSVYAAFSEITLALIDKHVPTKTLYPSRKHKNCFGKDILTSVK